MCINLWKGCCGFTLPGSGRGRAVLEVFVKDVLGRAGTRSEAFVSPGGRIQPGASPLAGSSSFPGAFCSEAGRVLFSPQQGVKMDLENLSALAEAIPVSQPLLLRGSGAVPTARRKKGFLCLVDRAGGWDLIGISAGNEGQQHYPQLWQERRK